MLKFNIDVFRIITLAVDYLLPFVCGTNGLPFIIPYFWNDSNACGRKESLPMDANGTSYWNLSFFIGAFVDIKIYCHLEIL